MRMRASLGFFLLLLIIGAMLAPTRRPHARGYGGTGRIGQSSYAQGASRLAVLHHPEGSRAKVAAAYGKLPLSFEANQGQTEPRVKFLSRGSGYTLFLTSTEAVLVLRKPSAAIHAQKLGKRTLGSGGANAAALRMRLVGSNAASQLEGLGMLPGRSSHFIGNEPVEWCTNIPTYAKVRFEGIYPGVDLVYYGNQGQLEYDFVVGPRANPISIRLAIAGAKKLKEDADGDLVLGTAGGEVRLHKPIVYQQAGGVRKEIAGRYVLRGKRQIGFEVAAYDASKPLIIDPVLSYSTYLGGSAEDLGNAIAVDASGNAYVTGSTRSLNFPTKNSVQASLAGGSDVFVTKLDPTGSTLLYSTYLGGSSDDRGSAITVDASGNAYLTGATSSANFPTTPGAFQTSPPVPSGQPFCIPGPCGLAFVTKLNSTGSALVYSTYLGGTRGDQGRGIAVDASGNAYVTGNTDSPDFPTKNPLQTAFGGGGGAGDAFVTKLNAAGSALVYSTFLGGSAEDLANGIAVDASGNAYVTGQTSSTNFPTANPFQPTCGACSRGQPNAFVSKLNAAGSALVYSTYLGGTGGDSGNGIVVDASGNAYVTGQTSSINFPTKNPLQAALGGGGDAFVTKLDPTGSALVYSTYLGGTGGDSGNGIVVDASGNAYVAGTTSSTNFPLASPIQSSLVLQTCLDYYYGGSFPCGNTAFVTKLNAAGSAPVYSTYVGASGGNFESGSGIALDTAGNVYVTGSATSGFPLTPGAFQLVPGGGGDAFVAKISPNDAAGFSLTSFSLAFPDEGIGGTTAAQTVTLANSGSATLTIASIVPSGDFAETNTCGSSLAGGTSCALSVTFTPTASGARTGTITITDSVASSPQKVTLTGNGIAGLASTLSPTSLSFGNQTLGTTSAAQSVTLTNTGSAGITINGFSFAGTNPSDFTLLANCNQGQSLAVGASCAFSIGFVPQAVGNRSATLQILDNSAQSPRTVSLTGMGIAPPTVTLSATALSFPAQVVGTTSPGQTITLTTSGSGTLAISSISTSIGDFRPTNTCGSSVPGGGSCTITVTFTPIVPGNRTGMLVIASNAANGTNGTQMVSLSGFGTSGTDFSISPAAGSSSSATVTAGQSATYTVSVAGTSGFSGTVSLSCSDPAPQSTCGVSPNSLMVNGTTAQNATVTVTTMARSALPPRLRPPILPPGLRVVLPWLLLALSLVMLTGALRRRSRGRRAWVGLAAMLMAAALFFGCGGGGSNAPPPPQQGTPAGTYPITVTAMSAGVAHTTTLTLRVN